MCLQDLRIAAGGTPNVRVDTVPAAGNVTLPDLTDALWVGVFDGAGAAVQVFFPSRQGTLIRLPRNAEMVGLAGATGYYTRDHCGPMFGSSLVYVADGVSSYTITWLEMDAETFNAIQPQPYPG